MKNKNGKLVFAADRRISSESMYFRSPTAKLLKKDNIIIGSAGDAFINKLVENSIQSPDLGKQTVDEYMYNDFFPNLMETLKKQQIVHKDENRLNVDVTLTDDEESDSTAIFLLAIEHKLYELQLTPKAIILNEVSTPFAIGSGGDFAMGSLVTTVGMKMSAVDRLKRAIQVASALCPSVGDGIDILSE